MLNIDGLKNATENVIQVSSLLVSSTNSVLAIQDTIDLLHDGVHMEDIINFMKLKQDITGDNIFDSYDIRLLIQQIKLD